MVFPTILLTDQICCVRSAHAHIVKTTSISFFFCRLKLFCSDRTERMCVCDSSYWKNEKFENEIVEVHIGRETKAMAIRSKK